MNHLIFSLFWPKSSKKHFLRNPKKLFFDRIDYYRESYSHQRTAIRSIKYALKVEIGLVEGSGANTSKVASSPPKQIFKCLEAVWSSFSIDLGLRRARSPQNSFFRFILQIRNLTFSRLKFHLKPLKWWKESTSCQSLSTVTKIWCF